MAVFCAGDPRLLDKPRSNPLSRRLEGVETEVEDVGGLGTATAGLEGTLTGVESIGGIVGTAIIHVLSLQSYTYIGTEPRTPELSAHMLPLSHPYGGEQMAPKQHATPPLILSFPPFAPGPPCKP